MKGKCTEVMDSASNNEDLSHQIVDFSIDVTFTDITGKAFFTFIHINSTTATSEVERLIREQLPKLENENFDLLLKNSQSPQMITLNEFKSKTLKDWNINEENSASLTVVLTEKCTTNRMSSVYMNDSSVIDDDLLLGASASPTTGETPSSNDSEQPEEYPDFGYDRCRLNVGPTGDYNAHQIETAINYVGLVNQAMTCYLNSLVQALFMTPEFRNAIYNWEFDGKNETKSIPYQLQKLFLNLQTSERSAVETTDLTTSFGWQGSEAWHQHDIQELCRVMFDALERKFEKTKQANLINDLYEGKMLDYVKCLECGTEKSREDTFLDIPLPVRPFGSTVAYNSIQEAMNEFVQPETLDGNNQYYCEKCGKKCDAHKGLKFIKFPYLLTLHLKRFDFDYNTMHRIKLNDKVEFPEKLNLNYFVPNRENELEERETIVRCDECSTTDSGSALDDESCQGTDVSSTANEHDENGDDSDEGIDVSSGNGTTHQESEIKGPYIYELFSIMIHSGSASGGHYYAYIKDFSTNHWLCFNDQSVTPITDDDIRKTYGGGGPQKGYYSGVYTSSTNAYMLMYRQIDKDRNSVAIKVDHFPPHITQLLERMREKDKEDRLNREKLNNSLRFNVYCINPVTDEITDIRLNVCRDSTLKEATEIAHRRFKLSDLVDIENCRLVLYNKKLASIDQSFDSDDVKFCDILETLKSYYCLDLLLEIKRNEDVFRNFIKGGVDVKTYLVDIENEIVQEPTTVRIDVGDNVGLLRQKVADLFNIENIYMVLTTFFDEPQYLEDDKMLVPLEHVSPEMKLYVTNFLDDIGENKFENSKFKCIIEKFRHVVYLGVLLPDTQPSVLENLFIPSLDTTSQLNDYNNILERTNSPNLRISPQPPLHDNFGDQSNSEDSSLSDSDRTLVGDAPGECQGMLSSNSTSPADQHMISPMDSAEDMYNYDVAGNQSDEMNWDTSSASKHFMTNYFKLLKIKDCRHTSSDANYIKLIKVYLDNRMTLEQFKKHLESVVRVPKEYFKIFRYYSSPDDEWSNLSETLRLTRDGQLFSVKLGRALANNEYSCKVFLLKLTTYDTNYFLFEHIITKGQTVGQIKSELVFKAKKLNMLDSTVNKCRLREKCIKRPKKVFLDEQIFGDDLTLLPNYEIYLQELDEIDGVVSLNQMVLFGRHWLPSSLTLKPFVEIILETKTMDELKRQIAEISQIPLEDIQVAFLRHSFPSDMNLLDIHGDLDWEHNYNTLDQWPLNADDGTVFFYRDKHEKLKELTSEERKEINIKENTRLGRGLPKSYTSLERSLKIYLDTWSSEAEDNCID